MKLSHIIVLVVVVVIVFGASKLPEIAKSFGQSAKILKKEMRELQDDVPPQGTPGAAVPEATATPQQFPLPPQTQPQYGQPQYGQPQYGQPQYGQPQYGQVPHPAAKLGNQPNMADGNAPYVQAPYGQAQPGHAASDVDPAGANGAPDQP